MKYVDINKIGIDILLAYWLIGLLAYWLIGLLAYWSDKKQILLNFNVKNYQAFV